MDICWSTTGISVSAFPYPLRAGYHGSAFWVALEISLNADCLEENAGFYFHSKHSHSHVCLPQKNWRLLWSLQPGTSQLCFTARLCSNAGRSLTRIRQAVTLPHAAALQRSEPLSTNMQEYVFFHPCRNCSAGTGKQMIH